MAAWLQKMIPSGYVRKLVLFGVLLGCLPVIAIGAFSYSKTADMLKEKNLQKNRQSILQTQSYVEYILMNSDEILRSFITSRNVQLAMQSDLRGADFIYFQEVSRQLSSAVPFDVANTDICLVNYRYNWVLNSNGLYRLDEAMFGDLYRAYGDLPQVSAWVPYFDTLPKNQVVYDYFFSGNAVNLVKKIPLNSILPTGIAVIKIPCEYLNQTLTVEAAENGALILDDQFRVIASTNSESVGESYQDSQLASCIKAQEMFELEIDKERYSVIASRSEYNGWYYVSLVSISDVLHDSKVIRQFTAVVAMVCLFAVLVISILGSRWMYQPIYSLYQELLDPMYDEADEEVRDEFAFIRKQISALIMSMSSPPERTQAQLRQLKEYFTIKILLGDWNQTELEQKLSLFESETKEISKRVVVIQCDSLDHAGYLDQDSDILMFAINNVASELLEYCTLLTPVIVMQSQVTIVKSPKEEEEKFKAALLRTVQSIQKNVTQYFGVSVSVGISRPFEDYKMAANAFQEGLEALKYRIKQGSNTIVFFEEVQIKQHAAPFSYLKSQQELIQAVKSFDTDRAFYWLELFLDDVFQMQVSHLEYQVPAAGLLTELILAMQEAGAEDSISHNGQKSLFEQLFELKTREEIHFWFCNVIIEPFVRSLCEIHESQSKKLAEEMIAMVQECYDQELSLEICAAQMNYHPGYLRRVFLKETGENFGEYLTAYRMEIAKTWLQEGDMRVFDIAQRLQYSNSQNFIRCFKKYTGYTPGQYRKQYREL